MKVDSVGFMILDEEGIQTPTKNDTLEHCKPLIKEETNTHKRNEEVHYLCDICKKAFCKEKHLTAHMKTHRPTVETVES